jgi:hypothetical protein|tara:strand:+ start:3210 stop:3416 length:207 start_codon:yes stop_codon:yes gene_type:complete
MKVESKNPIIENIENKLAELITIVSYPILSTSHERLIDELKVRLGFQEAIQRAHYEGLVEGRKNPDEN